MVFFPLYQCYDIIIRVYWFEVFSQVSDVAHGPLVKISNLFGENENFILGNYGDIFPTSEIIWI